MTHSHAVRVGPVTFAATAPLALIAGPCVIESRDSTLRHAEGLRDLTAKLGVPFVFKSSFDKANRTSGASFRGPGMDAGLAVLDEVRRELGVPVLTDIHEIAQVSAVAASVDVLQTPGVSLSADRFLGGGRCEREARQRQEGAVLVAHRDGARRGEGDGRREQADSRD